MSSKKGPGRSPRQSEKSRRIPSVAAIARPFLFLLLIPSLVLCREDFLTVNGIVIDASTGKGLPFAHILVEKTDHRTSSNASGEFQLPLPSGGSKLIASYVGYKTDTAQVYPDGSPITIRLSPVGYAIKEVNILANKTANAMLNSFQIGQAQIRDFSGAMMDPMRSIQLLPGVSTDNEMSARVNVRGGTSDENMILIDGAEVYRPYHLNEVSMSSIGLFNSELVSSIDFSAGGWAAKYGNALSSVMNINYKEGSRDHFVGTADLGIMDLSGSFEGPINQNGSFIVAARGSYLGYLLKEIKMGQGIYAGYYDVQGHIVYDFSKLNKLSVTFIYSRDNAEQAPTNMASRNIFKGKMKGESTLVTQNTNTIISYGGNYSTSVLSFGFENMLSTQLVSRTLVYYSGQGEHQWPVNLITMNYKYAGFSGLWTGKSINVNLSDDLAMGKVSLNQELDYQATPFLDVDAGINIDRVFYDYAPHIYNEVTTVTNIVNFPDTTVSSVSIDSSLDTAAINVPTYALGGYVQQTVRVLENMKLNLGFRFDYFDMDRESRCSPRADLSYLLPLDIKLNVAWGVYYQLPNYAQLRSGQPSGRNTSFQKATNYLVGLEKSLPGDGHLSVDFYQKYYSDLIPARRLQYGGLSYGSKLNDAVGYAKGMDVQWTMNLKYINFVISYSYLVAKEMLNQTNAVYYPSITDQRHTASIAVVFNLGRRWTASMEGFYGSGYAYTPYVTRFDSTLMTALWVQGGNNSDHYPPYERIDIRVSKILSVLGSPMTVYLNVTNVLNRKNVAFYNFTYNSNGGPERVPLLLLGTVPTIGVHYTFDF